MPFQASSIIDELLSPCLHWRVHMVFSTWKSYFAHQSSLLEQHCFPGHQLIDLSAVMEKLPFSSCLSCLHFFPHRTCACCWLPLGTPEHSSVAFFLQWVVPWSLWSSLSSAVTETSVADLRSSPGFPQPGFSHWDISQLVACPGLTAFIEVKDALTQLWVQEKAPSQGWKVSEEMEKEEERVSVVV